MKWQRVGRTGVDVFPIYIQRDEKTGQVEAAMIRFDGAEPT